MACSGSALEEKTEGPELKSRNKEGNWLMSWALTKKEDILWYY
jgi:hypothetical protein